MNAQAGRIGPNAITRVAEVLLPRLGHGATAGIFEQAGLLDYLAHPPQEMEVSSAAAAARMVMAMPCGR